MAGETGTSRSQAIRAAEALLAREPRLVFLMCGLAGSGKTTFAQELVALGCERLSIDEEVWRHDGRYGVDYEASAYPALQVAAEARLRRKLEEMLAAGTQAVLDYSFWSAASRAEYRALVERHDHLARVIHLRVPEAVLAKRLRLRAPRRDANAAFPIGEDVLAGFVRGFEVPDEPGTWIVEPPR